MKKKVIGFVTSKLFLIVLSFVLLVPNFIDVQVFPVMPYNQKDIFDPTLAYINSVDNLEMHVDSLARNNSIEDYNSIQYVETIATTLRKRFYHGYSYFSLNENWMAVAAGKFLWDDLAAKIFPEDIIKHPYAACSQQAIVMMALLRKKSLSYRAVTFPHHYALTVSINNKWYYFDTNMEPSIKAEERLIESMHNEADSLKQYYDQSRYTNLDYVLGVHQQMIYRPVNEKPGPNARFFQAITGILSKTIFLLPLFVLYYRSRKKESTQ